MTFAALLLLALCIEAAVGWPKSAYRLVRHPVVWIGALISACDSALNQPRFSAIARRVFGLFTTLLVVTVVTAIALSLSIAMPDGPVGFVLQAAIASSLLASRSLYTHVAAIEEPLINGDIARARQSVSHIVGRDPETLDAPAIARASIESLAENTSDGVVAPIFWGVIFGLPGIAAYKAINTLDSMIGHKTTRYSDFGWASAKLDDVANYLPARLTALLFIAAGAPSSAIRVVLNDAGLHRSPNAGWPEAAMAGAVGVRLSGPRSYHGRRVDEPWVNGSCTDPDGFAIRRSLRHYVRTILLLALLLAVLALAQALR